MPVGFDWWLGKIPLLPSNIIDWNIVSQITCFCNRFKSWNIYLLIKIRRYYAIWKGSVTCDVIDSDRIGGTGARWRWDRVTGTRSVSGPRPPPHPSLARPAHCQVQGHTKSRGSSRKHSVSNPNHYTFQNNGFLIFLIRQTGRKILGWDHYTLNTSSSVEVQKGSFECIHREYNKL